MKKLFTKGFLLIIIFHLSNTLFAQGNLIGVWQENLPNISSAYLQTYQFFPDGTFIYNTNQYDGLRKLISFGGDYKVNDNKINFTVKFIVEEFGGDLQRDEASTGSGLWTLEGGEEKKTMLKSPKKFTTSFEQGTTEKNKDFITIDSFKYYRILKDPKQF